MENDGAMIWRAVSESKYCPLLETENGLPLLERLYNDPRPYPKIKRLASQVIRRCRLFHDQPNCSSDDDEVEDSSGPAPMLIDD